MITIVGVNQSIDRMVEVEGFRPGKTNRIVRDERVGAGKAVHVAIALRRLGAEVACIGLLAKGGAEQVIGRLKGDGIAHDFIRVPGDLRTNLKIIDRLSGEMTELNEPGPTVSAQVESELVSHIKAYAARSDCVVLTGSLPPGLDGGFYGRIMKGIPCPCALDAAGPALGAGIKAGPLLIKPNLQELCEACGEELTTQEELCRAAIDLARGGIGYVAVSMGAQGALLANGRRAVYAPALDVPVLTTVGAGDSMVAGLLYAHGLGEDLSGMLRWGVAAASATVMRPLGQLMEATEARGLLGRVKVDEIYGE